MGDKSAIEWTDASWNPVTGCSKVSPGCAHCYAEAVTERYAGRPGWIDEHRPWTPANAAHNVRLRPERLDQPLRWRKPRMVFVNSMSDLFHEAIPKEYIAAVFGVMAAAEQHTFQVLTKRPERMREWFAWYAEEVRDREEGWSPGAAAIQEARRAGVDERYLYCRDDDLGWPLPNVWLGVSIENRRYIGRADLLRETPAAVRFISAEPLLGPLVHEGGCIDDDGRSYWYEDYTGPQLDLTGIDWLITGGESGPKHRRLDLEWVRDLRDAAVASGTAFFHKQHGGRTPKAGGRELDGREWSEFPSVPGEGTGS